MVAIRENCLSKEEIIGIKWVVQLSHWPDELHNCHTGTDACFNPATNGLSGYGPGGKSRAVNDNRCARGCTGKPVDPKGKWREGYGIPFSDQDNDNRMPSPWFYCPRLFQKSHIMDWAVGFRNWEDHDMLPIPGKSMEDQPNKWVEAMRLFKGEVSKCENERTKRQNEKNAKAKNKGRGR